MIYASIVLYISIVLYDIYDFMTFIQREERVAIAPALEESLRHAEGGPQPLKSLYGLWQDFGIDLSEEEIDAARREMWGAFSRDDI